MKSGGWRLSVPFPSRGPHFQQPDIPTTRPAIAASKRSLPSTVRSLKPAVSLSSELAKSSGHFCADLRVRVEFTPGGHRGTQEQQVQDQGPTLNPEPSVLNPNQFRVCWEAFC